METQNHLRGLAGIIIILVVSISSCKSQKETSSATIPQGAVKATVIDYRELDGCTYLLELENKNKLQPINLPAEFQKNGLRLYVLYKNHNGVGICMAGTMVELTFVQEIK